MTLATPFSALLESASNERPILAWLKKNPLVLTRAIPFGHYVTSEFPFGSDFKADFVVLGPYSGGIDVHFLELEPANERLFTKRGNTAKRLAGAIAQVDSWKTFIEHERSTVVRELAKYFHLRELIFKRRAIPCDNCGWRLNDPRLHLNWRFEIVIGRRSEMAEEHLQLKASFWDHHDIEVMTYDRLLQGADTVECEECAPLRR
jgi:hypothetical protein